MTKTLTNALLPVAAWGQHFIHVCAVKWCECGWVQSQLISLLTPGFGALFKLPLLTRFSTWVHGAHQENFTLNPATSMTKELWVQHHHQGFP